MSGIIIDVNAKTAKAEQQLANVEKAVHNIDKTTSKTSDSIRGMVKALGALAAGGFALNYIKSVSTEFTSLNNKIATVTGRSKELLTTQKQLFDMAERTRGSLTSTVQVFSSFGRALKSTGTPLDKILKVTESIQKAVAIDDMGAQSAAAAIIQLGQGISSGVLRGEELNSVLEQAPRIAKAIADELDTTTGKLRGIAAEGKLTSDVVFKALLNQSKSINSEFNQLAPSLGQAKTALSDSVKIYVSELDKGLGLTAAMGIRTFDLSKAIRQASRDAFELGTRIAFYYHQTMGGIKSIAKPIFGIFAALSKQFLKVLPRGVLTRTLKKDLRDAMTILDRTTGGYFEKVKNFNPFAKLDFKSDVEKALDDLKGLNPKNWTGAGWNKLTLERFFSRKNLQDYAAGLKNLAVAIAKNYSTLGSRINEFVINAEFGWRRVKDYFNFDSSKLFTFKRGHLENFLKSINEFAKGLTGLSTKIWQVGRVISENFLPEIYAVGYTFKEIFTLLPTMVIDSLTVIINYVGGASKSLADTLSDFVKVFFILESPLSDLFETVKRIFSKIAKIIRADEILEALRDFSEKTSDEIKRLFDGIMDRNPFTKALASIRDFGKKVIDVFFRIYDAVIGHSWWTDTVETVVDTSKNLWKRAKVGLATFAKGTVTVFQGLFSRVKNFDIAIPEFKKFKLVISEFKFPKVKSSSFMDAFISIKESLTELMGDLFQAFPSLMKAALAFAGAVLVQMLFPVNIIKKFLLAALITSFATSGTIVAERFGAALTGDSLMATIGYKIGEAVGFGLHTAARELPLIIADLGKGIAGFFRGLMEQFPKIATAMKGLFNFTDLIDLSSPMGILGAVLLGSIGMDIFSVFKKGKQETTYFGKVFKGLSDLVKGERGGIFSKFIYGKLGSTRTISLFGLLIDQMGMFDSLFRNMPALNWTVKGGILAGLWQGDDLAKNVSSTVKNSLIKPLTSEIKKFIQASRKLDWLNAIIYGGVGAANSSLTNTVGKRLKLAVGGAFDSFTTWAAAKLQPAWDGTINYLSAILFGQNPDATINGIKLQFMDILSWIRTKLGTLSASKFALNLKGMFSKPSNQANINPLFNNFTGLLGGSGKINFGTVKTSLLNIFNLAKKQLLKLSLFTQRIAGSQGLLGRLFLGKFGKVAIITTILALLAGIASASETANDGFSETSSPLEDLANTWNKIKLENPFLTLTTVIIGTTLVTLLGALIKFRSQVAAIFTGLLNPSAIQQSFALLSAYFGGSGAMVFKRAGVAAGAFLVGGIAGRVAKGKTEFDVSTGVLLASLSTLIPKAFVSAITTAISSAISAIGVVPILITAAFLSGFAALGVLIFGPKGKFWETIGDGFKWVWQHTLGSLPKEIGRSGLSKEIEKLAKSSDISIKFSVDKIDFDKLSEKQSKKLKEMLKEFSEQVDAADFEKLSTGEISSDTRKSLDDLNRALDKYTQNLTALTGEKVENFDQYLESLKTFKEAGTWFDEIQTRAKQFQLDRAYATNSNMLWLRKTLNNVTGRDNTDTFNDMKKLEQLRDTKYNVRYKGPVSTDFNYLIDLEKQTKNLMHTNDQMQIATEALERKFVKIGDKIQDIENSWHITPTLGLEKGMTVLPDTHPLKREYNDLIDKLIKAKEAQIQFNQESENISKFQKRLSNLQNTLKDVGITLDTSDLFAGDEESLLRLEHLSTAAQRIMKDMAQTDNVADLNKYSAALAGVKIQINDIVTNSKINDNSRKQFKLKELADSIGINWVSDRSFRGLGDTMAHQLYAEMLKFKSKMEMMKTKFPSSLANVGTTYDKEHKALLQNLAPDDRDYLYFLRKVSVDEKSFVENLVALFNGNASAYNLMAGAGASRDQSKNFINSLFAQLVPSEQDYLMQLAGVEEQTRKFSENLLIVLNDSNKVLLSSDLAANAGVDLSQVVRYKGFDRSLNLLKQFKTIQDDIYAAESAGDTRGIGKLYQKLNNIKDTLGEVPSDLQSFISNVSSLGTSLSLEDIAQMDSKSVKILASANTLVKSMNKELAKTDGVVSKSKIDRIFKQKFAAAQMVFKTFFANLGKSISSQVQLFKDAGISDYKQMLAIPEAMRNKIIDAQKKVVRLNHLLAIGDKSKPFKQIVSELSEAENILNRMKKIFDTFAGKLDAINQAFGMNLSREEFSMLPEDIQIQLSDSARTMLDKLDGTLTSYLATNATAKGKPQNNGTPGIKTDIDFKADIKQATNVFKEQREATFAMQRKYLQSGISNQVAKDSFGTMKTSEVIDTVVGVIPKLSDMKDQLQLISSIDLQRLYNAALDIQQERKLQDINAGNQTARQVADATTRVIKKAVTAVAKKDFGAELKFALKDMGLNIENAAFNMIDAAGRSKIEGFVKAIEAETVKLKAEGATPEQIRAAQNVIDITTWELNQEIERASKNPEIVKKESIKAAGENMASSVHSGLVSAFQGLLKGQDDLGDFVMNIMSTLTNSIVDTFINGMLDPLTGEGGLLTEGLKSFGTSLYDNVSGIFTDMFTGIKDVLTRENGLGSKIFSFFNGIINNIQNAFAQAGQASGFWGTTMGFISGLFGGGGTVAAATGGFITGPGTGTSDSIYARLSNGEYIINAKQTRRHRRLLEAINSNTLPHFNMGGPVTGINSTLPMRNDAEPAKRKVKDTQQQVINLNITGDVSRQTRAEIFRMLPSIANGVNAHNKETGYKG